MTQQAQHARLLAGFNERYGRPPTAVAWAPGRLEVLGNHTDYNAGLTLSCAVADRCWAALAPSEQPVARLASTLSNEPPQAFPLSGPAAPRGHWANYVLGLVAALRAQGRRLPGFSLLVDSAVPPSSGLSSSAALTVSVANGLCQLVGLTLDPIEIAKLCQRAESDTVGARTGLLDPLSALLGQQGHLLQIDFRSLEAKAIPMPPGWCFVAVDSGVKHDLTQQYNDRRRACENAAGIMGVPSLRDAGPALIQTHHAAMTREQRGCAMHVIGENQRVQAAGSALTNHDPAQLGRLMFASHASSRDHFNNSCPQLDASVAFAQADDRCVGARLSGGGFGGISIHLVRTQDAESYRADLALSLSNNGAITGRTHRRAAASPLGQSRPWSCVCTIADGAAAASF